MRYFLVLIFLAAGLLLRANDEIHNGENPKQSKAVQFKQDLVVGTEDGEDYEMFGPVTDLAVGKDGSMYILDNTNHRVLLFGSDGRFMATFGGKGEGPGEFGRPMNIAVDQAGTVYVMDGALRCFSIFDGTGKFVRRVLLEQGVVAAIWPGISENGNMGFTAVKLDPNFQQTYVWLLMNQEGQILKEHFPTPTAPVDWQQMNAPGFFADYLKIQFESVAKGMPQGVAIGHNFVVCPGKQYEGYIMDDQGQVLTKFSKKHKPQLYNDDAKRSDYEEVWENLRAATPFGNQMNQAAFEKALAEAEIPDTLSPVNNVIATENGFAILSNYSSLSQEGVIDFFNVKGEWEKSGPYKGASSVIKCVNGNLYTMGYDENNVNVLTRFRIQ